MTPAVSVVLPVWNREALIGGAIRSVLRQTCEDFELIVVDDASTDGTAAVVEAISDARVRLIRLPDNGRQSVARNRGVAAARADLVAFQDSDDEWLPTKLERQLAALEAAPPGTGAAYTAFERIAGDAVTYIPARDVSPREGDILPALLLRNLVSTQTLLVRKALLEAIGGFDEEMTRDEDWDLVIRLAQVTRFALVDEAMVRVVDHADSVTHNVPAGLAARRQMLEKHRALIEAAPRAHAAHRRAIGHLACLAGDTRTGRRELLAAARLRPADPKVLVGLLLSVLGPAGYRRALGLLGWDTSK
jgi:glycosyltransferase involved in cell wall biosynthesis